MALKALMGYALSARGIFAQAQKCRMYQSRPTFPQGVALGCGQHLGLQPAPIIAKRPPCALSIENPERRNVGWGGFDFLQLGDMLIIQG